jgi:hypothetical protein
LQGIIIEAIGPRVSFTLQAAGEEAKASHIAIYISGSAFMAAIRLLISCNVVLVALSVSLDAAQDRRVLAKFS